MRRPLFLLSAIAAACAGAAFAADPYIVPTTFAPSKDVVTVQAAITEGAFFVPNGPLRGEGEFVVTGPDGKPVKSGPGTGLREYAYLEAGLPSEGTFRISTGDRAGRSNRFARIDGVWTQIRQPSQAGRGGGGRGEGGRGPGGGEGRGGPQQVDDAQVPAGAERMESVSYMKAETFVTRGAPSDGALKTTGQGFEFAPVTHPNAIFVGEPFKFGFLADGKPAPGLDVTVEKAGDAYAETKVQLAAKTDAMGHGAVTFKTPGVYVLKANWPGGGRGAPGAPPVPRSVNYTVTLEVTP